MFHNTHIAQRNVSHIVCTIVDILQNDQRDVDEDEENEIFAADQNVADICAEISTQPFSTSLQIENIEEATFSVAPAEGNRPKYILMDPTFEPEAYPDLFPYGTGCFREGEYVSKLPIREYYKQRFMNVDGRFASNIEYIFSGQYATELKHIQGNISMAMLLKGGRSYKGRNITAGMLRDSAFISNMVKQEDAYKFLKTVRGSPAYWQNELFDILAMLRQFGTPTFFLTLSVADYQWPEIIQAIASQRGEMLTDEDVHAMSWEQKSMYLRSNPVVACRMFQHRVQSFITTYLCSKANPIGKVVHYAIKTEFQARGTPHIHALIWIEDAPVIDVASDKVVCSFVNKHLSGKTPLNEHTLHLQTHQCSSMYCSKKKKQCRFGFPKPFSKETLICRKPCDNDGNVDTELLNTAEGVLQRVKNTFYMNTMNIRAGVDTDDLVNMSTDEILEKCNISLGDYMKSLSVSKTGTTIVLEREPKDMRVNGHNPGIAELWNGNTDMQFVANAYSAIMYVCSYMMKAEKGMSELLMQVGRECNGLDLKQQLKAIGKAFIGHREVSAQEAVMRSTSIPLMQKSTKVIFVSSNTKSDRISLPRFDLNTLDDAEEDVFATSVHDRYAARPNTLDEMCLAQFATSYEVSSRADSVSPDDHVDIDCVESSSVSERVLKHIVLKNGLGKMMKRNRPSVLRTHNHNIYKDREKHFHGKLMLFYPWRTEDELYEKIVSPDHEVHSYEKKYAITRCIVDLNAHLFNQNSEEVNTAWDMLQREGPPQHAWDAVAPSIEMDNARSRDEGVEILRFLQYDKNDEKNTDALGQKYLIEAKKIPMTTPEYIKQYAVLNQQQKIIVDYNRRYCKAYVKAHRNGTQLPEPYRVFLSGPGGTGKSHIINLIHRDLLHMFRNCNIGEEEVLVLKTAPMGTSAFNIGGLTYHSALCLYKEPDILTNERRTVLRTRLGHLKLIIIDECSMIGKRMWNRIHKRLCQIRDMDPTSCPFGNICVLVLGDLYQLPPVLDSPVTQTTLRVRTVEDLAPSPWSTFAYHELYEIMRQREDVAFAELLNKVRKGEIVVNTKEDFMLRDRIVKVDETHSEYPNELIHVYATNKLAGLRNLNMLSQLTTQMYTIQSVDGCKDQRANLATVKLSESPKDTGSLLKELQLRVGARIMLTHNIDVSDGLTNGATGIVEHFICNSNPTHHTEDVECVIVKFDNKKIGISASQRSRYTDISKTGVPIKRYTALFIVKDKITFEATRCQFPFKLAWGVTIYKVQGMTLDTGIVVDIHSHSGGFRNGEAYVAFSRVREYKKLHILNYNIKQIKACPLVLAEE